MHIGIPFDVATVRQSWNQAARMWGRVVANHDFVWALVAADACTRLTLFVPLRRDVDLLHNTLLADCTPYRSKIFVVPYVEMPTSLQNAPVDVMHVLDPGMWWAGHVRSRLAGRPFVITGVTHSLGNRHFLDWVLLNHANGIGPDDCLVCTTATAQAVVERVFARLQASLAQFHTPATTVIPLGIAAQPRAGSRAHCRWRLGLDAGTFVVLSLARFNPCFKMDLGPVIELAARVGRSAACPVRFLLAGSSGDGEYLRFMQQQVQQRGLGQLVDFRVDPDEDEKARLLGAADVFLSLSDNVQETFGLTVVEALAAGLPVVASDWNGYRSLVEDGVSGFLVPTRTMAPDHAWESLLALRDDSLAHLFSAQITAVDLDVACARLLQLAQDMPLRDRMSEAARQGAQRFAWPAVIPRYLRLWQDMCARPYPPPANRSSALHFRADFAAYASAHQQDEDRFSLTATGLAILGGKGTRGLYAETDEFLNPELFTSILKACREPRTVAQLVEQLATGTTSKVQVRQNILWLYKYGYLQLIFP